MKIIYKPYIVKEMHAAYDKACNLNRVINKFVLTKEEFAQFSIETENMKPQMRFNETRYDLRTDEYSTVWKFLGAEVEVE
jgi:hypothetical protein